MSLRVESLHQVTEDERIEADLCLVGSGPAALTLAAELRNEKLRVLILESGGLSLRPETEALSEIENVGMPRTLDQTKVRNRGVGGSSQTWAGRCALLDPIDFEARPWIPLSGWPISLRDLEPFVARACGHLGLQPFPQDAQIWPHLTQPRPQPDVDGQKLTPIFWQYSRDEKDPLDYLRFGPRFLRDGPENCRLIHSATVTHIDTNRDGSALEGLEVTDATGRRRKVACRHAVLCAGGIENPRLLLASRRIVPEGVGNQRGLVGRYLMDHPRCSAGSFDLRHPARLVSVRDHYGFFRLRRSGAFILHGLALSEKVQREEGLVNGSAWLNEYRSELDPWDALKRLRRPGPGGRRRKDVAAVLGQPGELISGLRRRLLQGRGLIHRLSGLTLEAMVEQEPDASSRLTLSERQDRFGMPLPRIDWRIGDNERRSLARLTSLVVETFPRLGLAPPEAARWIREHDFAAAELYDPAHPSGTTRMADSPERGVVDADGQVHGVRGLYVAGGSVFPTNGHANPTMTIVALAVRLAEHLRQKLPPASVPVEASRPAGGP